MGPIEVIIKKIREYSFKQIKRNTAVIITLPTPKQEIIAKEIYYKNPKLNILCLGGALNIVSVHEKAVPVFLEEIGMEFFWRLKTDPLRRTLRLIISFYKAIIFMFFYRREYEFKQK